ncbi:MAG TPA: hypothetical protein VGM67_06680 [Gemmatimonadaceae bacterium]|jgi:hypothetical protein
MTTDRKAGWALIAGSVAGLVTMAMHPTAAGILNGARGAGVLLLNVAVHSLAIGAMPLLLLGLLWLTVTLWKERDLAVAAYVVYALATVAIMIAAAASGFVATTLLTRILDADAAARPALNNMLYYTGQINQAFAKISTVLTALSIICWSVAMRRCGFPRELSTYGIIVPIAICAALGSGHLTLGVHGYGLVALAQSVWMIWTGVLLLRRRVA